jgi:hypothetical protein
MPVKLARGFATAAVVVTACFFLDVVTLDLIESSNGLPTYLSFVQASIELSAVSTSGVQWNDRPRDVTGHFATLVGRMSLYCSNV